MDMDSLMISVYRRMTGHLVGEKKHGIFNFDSEGDEKELFRFLDQVGTSRVAFSAPARFFLPSLSDTSARAWRPAAFGRLI